VRISVQADEGDEVSISADFISVEQATVTLEIENTSYDSQPELESVTLSIDKARELAKALLSVVNAIEFVKAPANLIRLDRELRRISGIKRFEDTTFGGGHVWSVLPDNLDAIPQREPLSRICGNRCIERRVPDRNTR
jgi:hypothetical protein